KANIHVDRNVLHKPHHEYLEKYYMTYGPGETETWNGANDDPRELPLGLMFAGISNVAGSLNMKEKYGELDRNDKWIRHHSMDIGQHLKYLARILPLDLKRDFVRELIARDNLFDLYRKK